ncbi:hypothetical protein GDO81_003591 [Engystomops pustulosus]|uniref:Uncharacterized protein n=1 Tax=Engystomops pustulosus TaxID=76066 RepID=A0AAV6ZZI0_ENGPU|nr:hypothetical protein GDO81_003591 [Engystomops pustulosus]
MLVHSIQTQGARQRLLSIYISQFIVFYSINGQNWSPYQGNASSNQMVVHCPLECSQEPFPLIIYLLPPILILFFLHGLLL